MRRKLLVLGTGLLGAMIVMASCEARPPDPVARKQATATPYGAAAGVYNQTSRPRLSPSQLPTVVGSISCPAIPGASATGLSRFLSCQYSGGFDNNMTFYLYVPNGYDPSKTYPMVVILHGVGESSDPTQTMAANRTAVLSQEYVAVWGPGSPIGGPTVQTRWPCFVLVPQLVGANRWVNAPSDVSSYTLTKQPTVSLQMAINSTVLVEEHYSTIDQKRVYVTGISMGAYGVWDSIMRWPTLFAAAAPVAGAGDPALAKRIVRLPIWDFHGVDDNLVPLAGSQLMMQALESDGGHPCYTYYAGALHVIWDQVYGLGDNPGNPLYPWMFAQSRSNPASDSSCA